MVRNLASNGSVFVLFLSTTLPPAEWILIEYADISETHAHTRQMRIRRVRSAVKTYAVEELMLAPVDVWW